jgi:uracil-DNA glycosylase family 4
MSLFEAVSTTQRRSLPVVAQCWLCKLDKGCHSPKMRVSGQGRKEILIVGEAPGEEEDRRGRQFVGRTGQKLRRVIAEVGLDPDRDCWFTNALICRPPHNKVRDENAVEYCRPNLLKTVEELKPKVVVLLGKRAVRSLVGHLWKEDVKGIGRWVGFRIPCRNPNAWVCPTWHPSYVMRQEDKPNYRVLEMFWKKHLRWAMTRTDRPWKDVPDYKSWVAPVFDPNVAARIVRSMTAKRDILAFDYETNTLKPDSAQAKIVCCSVSDGRVSVAYPWIGEAIKATQEMIRSKVKKVASNLKFEERWTRAFFGHGVRNWYWDTMENAHIIDSRRGVKGLKFQSFVLLGQEDYDSAVRPYLRSKDGTSNGVNRIDEVALPDLLTYNALDSLLEVLVYHEQRRYFGDNSSR